MVILSEESLLTTIQTPGDCIILEVYAEENQFFEFSDKFMLSRKVETTIYTTYM